VALAEPRSCNRRLDEASKPASIGSSTRGVNGCGRCSRRAACRPPPRSWSRPSPSATRRRSATKCARCLGGFADQLQPVHLHPGFNAVRSASTPSSRRPTARKAGRSAEHLVLPAALDHRQQLIGTRYRSCLRSGLPGAGGEKVPLQRRLACQYATGVASSGRSRRPPRDNNSVTIADRSPSAPRRGVVGIRPTRWAAPRGGAGEDPNTCVSVNVTGTNITNSARISSAPRLRGGQRLPVFLRGQQLHVKLGILWGATLSGTIFAI